MLFVLLAFITVSLSHAVPISETSLPQEPLSYISNSYVAKDHSKAENRDGRGQYGLSYITANGIEVAERGYLKPAENGTYSFVKEGSYKYLDPNGVQVGYKFTADENGYVVANL